MHALYSKFLDVFGYTYLEPFTVKFMEEVYTYAYSVHHAAPFSLLKSEGIRLVHRTQLLEYYKVSRFGN